MTDNQISNRLRALGETPVDSATQSAHLTAMGAIRRASSWRHKLSVAGALLAGLVIGGTGLAAAGALPDTAQDKAQTTLSHVGVHVPAGHDRVTEGCDTDGDGHAYKNHGQYVKAHPGDDAAAQSDCGKPKVSVHDGTSENSCPTPDPTGAVNDHGQGKAKGADKAQAHAAKGCTEDHAGQQAEDPAGQPEDTPSADDHPTADDNPSGEDPPNASDQGRGHGHVPAGVPASSTTSTP